MLAFLTCHENYIVNFIVAYRHKGRVSFFFFTVDDLLFPKIHIKWVIIRGQTLAVHESSEHEDLKFRLSCQLFAVFFFWLITR